MNAFAKALKEGQFRVGKVCTDCTMVAVNGDGSGNDPDWNEAKYEATCAKYDVTYGHPHELTQWFTDCPHAGERCPDDGDCDCERDPFSTTECAMCGTRLHGERQDFIFIERH